MSDTASVSDPVTDPHSPEGRQAEGRAARKRRPRRTAGEWAPAAGRRDPLEILETQGRTRVPELVPIRYGRMAATRFAFYRGAAAVMAADLGELPTSGLTVQLCGDAHLANFGGFASPERSMVFDINDFDETHPGPFEWDVARLVASLEVAARHRSFTAEETQGIVLGSARSYRENLRAFAAMSNLDIWYARLDATDLMARWKHGATAEDQKRLAKTVRKAETKDRLKARSRLTKLVDGELRFVSDPPLLVPTRDLFAEDEHEALEATIRKAIADYQHTLSPDRQVLLARYRFVDLARKVVGVGSVGTRSWVALMVGRDDYDPLFLQIKEAEASVLEPYTQPSTFGEHGERVVEGQRLLQAASDILLGWQQVEGIDSRLHDYYVRQLWDWKASADLENMPVEMMSIYGEMCGWALARGHARSGDPIAIGAYLGKGDEHDRSMLTFAQRYADQNAIDHQSLLDAIASGAIEATTGV